MRSQGRKSNHRRAIPACERSVSELRLGSLAKRCRGGVSTPNAQRPTLSRHGFTLIELLVVMGLTAVLMLILFAPLSRTIDLSSRANAKIAGQDNVRGAMRRVVRDLSNAMEVYDPQNMAVYGFDTWTFRNKQFFPATGAAPEAYVTRNTLFAFRLPKHRYYCTRFDHAVTPRDIDNVFPPPRAYDDAVALDTCPRTGHTGSPVDLQPTMPLEPDDRITAYFVGLKNPAPAATGTPLYENILLFRNTRNNILNTYGLYRVEFDPRGIAGATDNNSNNLDDRWETFWTDPAFFYDTTPVTVTENGSSVTKPRYQWWKDLTISVMDAETSDVVRWLEAGGTGKVIPQSLVSFKPSASDDEAAQPNRNVGSFQLPGASQSSEFAPLEYIADNGHWTGLQHNATSPIANTLLMAPEPGTGIVPGVRIRVLDGSNPLTMGTLYDTTSATRNRLVTYDSVTGRVVLGISRSNEAATDANPQVQLMLKEAYAPDIDPNTYTVDLKQDLATYTNGFSGGMPSAFGSVLASYPNTTRIVPGSESLELIDVSGAVIQSEPMRRGGWTSGNSNTGEFVAQPDLEVDEYSIDYVTGVISLSTRDPNIWVGVGPNSSRRLLVKYKIQTNRPTDVVRVSYQTKEMASVHLGVVQYTRRRQEVLPFEVTERVVVRNLKR